MKRRTGKIKVPAERVRQLAAKYDEDYEKHMAEGFRLMGSSGFWQTKREGITARFVYRRRGDNGFVFTITCIVRGI